MCTSWTLPGGQQHRQYMFGLQITLYTKQPWTDRLSQNKGARWGPFRLLCAEACTQVLGCHPGKSGVLTSNLHTRLISLSFWSHFCALYLSRNARKSTARDWSTCRPTKCARLPLNRAVCYITRHFSRNSCVAMRRYFQWSAAMMHAKWNSM